MAFLSYQVCPRNSAAQPGRERPRVPAPHHPLPAGLLWAPPAMGPAAPRLQGEEGGVDKAHLAGSPHLVPTSTCSAGSVTLGAWGRRRETGKPSCAGRPAGWVGRPWPHGPTWTCGELAGACGLRVAAAGQPQQHGLAREGALGDKPPRFPTPRVG